MRTLLVALIIIASGCAAKYQRNVDYEMRELTHVIAVDVVWWKVQQQCQLRVVRWDTGPPGGALGQAVPQVITIDRVDPRLCGKKP